MFVLVQQLRKRRGRIEVTVDSNRAESEANSINGLNTIPDEF
jgi:hypothetical protein